MCFMWRVPKQLCISVPACSSSNGRRKLVAPLCRLEESQVGGHVCSPALVTMSDQPRRAKCRSTQATTWLFQLRPAVPLPQVDDTTLYESLLVESLWALVPYNDPLQKDSGYGTGNQRGDSADWVLHR